MSKNLQKPLDSARILWYHIFCVQHAGVVELADALDSKSCGSDTVWVRFPPPAPNSRNPNLVPIGEGFGFLLYLDYPNFNSKKALNN